jgi:putative chromate ion transporter
MKVDVQAQPRSDEDRLVRGVERVPLLRLVAYFLRLGTVGFGGPIALVGYMQRDLVEDKHWVSIEDYLQGLAFSQLSPGPLAAQLANYVGWVHSGTLGATLVGIAFVLPSLLMVLALAAMYVHFGQLAWIQGMFYGIGAAVSTIIVMLPKTTAGCCGSRTLSTTLARMLHAWWRGSLTALRMIPVTSNLGRRARNRISSVSATLGRGPSMEQTRFSPLPKTHRMQQMAASQTDEF